MIARAVKLTSAGQLKPGLKVLGHRAVQQGALGVAWVVGLGGLSGFSGWGRLGVRLSTVLCAVRFFENLALVVLPDTAVTVTFAHIEMRQDVLGLHTGVAVPGRRGSRR